MTLLKATNLEDTKEEKEVIKSSQALSEYIGFSKARVEKDLNLYISNLEKITQALDLMKESFSTGQAKRKEKTDKHKRKNKNKNTSKKQNKNKHKHKSKKNIHKIKTNNKFRITLLVRLRIRFRS